MKFVTVRDFRTAPAEIWKELVKEQEMVITNNGKPVAVMTPVTDATLEETVSSIRMARAVTAVKILQQEAIKKGLNSLSDEDIDNEISSARKS
jgi:prevent-host-death family protein